jgi:hypothetical protein
MELTAARVAEQVDRAASEAEARFARTGPVIGKAESGDGGISVEVAPGGLLTGLKLHRSALRYGSGPLAEQILELAQRATRRAGDRMYHTLAPVLGADDENLKALGYEPIPEDDADAESAGYSSRGR